MAVGGLTEIELEVPESGLLIGDKVLAWRRVGIWTMGGVPCVISRVQGIQSYYVNAGREFIFHEASGNLEGFRVRRMMPLLTRHPVVNGVAHLGPRRVPDWPKKCPRCQRADSAVLLFQSWDCRHGCFK
jgi:hypothetical protein